MKNRATSPLRYPGGKSILTDFFDNFSQSNFENGVIYAEPYCGGAGAATNLLLEDKVEKILLNDADPNIYSFWFSLKNYGEQFLNLFDNVNVTLDEWYRQKEINQRDFVHEEVEILEKGFSTFFLNRCNRSGILKAGPIGGKSPDSQNSANYKIDARFNKPILRTKLEKIINLSERIRISNMDALDFLRGLEELNNEELLKLFVYLDPPYYDQGSGLYLNYYTNDNHEELSRYLSRQANNFKWVLSYDNVSSIRELYNDFQQYTFYLNYSAQHSKLGSELLIHCRNSVLPEDMVIKKMKNDRQVELCAI